MSKLGDILQNRYETLVRASSCEQPFAIPSITQRYFINAYAFQYVAAIRRFVGDARRILIIGDGGGRDYYSMKLLGKEPIVVDVTQQSIIPDLVIADANAPLPFPPRSFDAVIMAEVIEHLPNDYGALKEIRQVVKEDGTLVLTVPYYQDAEPTHIRIHSPVSIERLLAATGWEIVSYIEKGGGLCRLADWLPCRMVLHALNLIAFNALGKTFYQPFLRRIAAIDFWLGKDRNSFHRWFNLYGAFIKCKKVAPKNYEALNALAFENMHLSLSSR
jgi:SAM-dependent methyltransferase